MKAARLVVLTVAIAAGGVAALLAGREKPPEPKPEQPTVKIESVDILVAKNDVPLGHTIGPGDLEWQAWPMSAASGNFIRKNEKPDALESIAGSIARAPFVGGEPIREQKLVKAKGSGFMAAILPQGMRAVSTQISAETGAGGFVLPNDRVDVIMTRRAGEGGDKNAAQTSETILKNVRVLAIDQAVEEKNGQKNVIGKTATLELTPGQAETLALSQQLGIISLALRSITDASAATDKDDPNSGRSTVNIIRFGVGTATTPK